MPAPWVMADETKFMSSGHAWTVSWRLWQQSAHCLCWLQYRLWPAVPGLTCLDSLLRTLWSRCASVNAPLAAFTACLSLASLRGVLQDRHPWSFSHPSTATMLLVRHSARCCCILQWRVHMQAA